MGLAKMGCAVSAIYPASGHPLSKTRVIQQRFCYSPLDPIGSLRTAIEAVDPDIVVPCDDRAVAHLHELHASDRNEFPSGSKVSALIEESLGLPESYQVVSSRYKLLKIAQEEGIRIPDTKLVTAASQLSSGDPELAQPSWVLKADCSWGGHGVRIADHPNQAEEFFLELSKPLGSMRFIKRLMVDRDPYWLQTWLQRIQPAVIAQSYIPGHPANSAVVCWKGKVLAGIAAEVVNAQGATGSATIVRIVDRPDMLLPAERLARRLGLSGFFGFDFMIEEETGDPFLIEMNPRCTPLSHLQLGNGRDLMAALWAQLSNTPLREQAPVTTNDTIAYFPQAWHWDPSSPLLQSSFQDLPSEEPELVRELLRLPWPDRSALARLTNVVRRTTFRHRARRGGVFESALANRKPPEAREPECEERRSFAGEVNSAGLSAPRLSAIVPLRAEGTKPPLFLIHGVDGTLRPFQDLVRRLEPDQPIYGVLSQAFLREPIALMSVEELAAYYIKAVQAVRPRGPYHFLGYSFGGLVAFEIARQLRDRGELVGMLGMVDNLPMGPPPLAETPVQRLRRFGADHIKHLLSPQAFRHIKEELVARFLKTIYAFLRARQRPIPRFLRRAININWFAARNYVPRFYPGSITLFQARASANDAGVTGDLWARLAGGGIELHSTPGGHEEVLAEPNVIVLAETLTDCLYRATAQPSSGAFSAGSGDPGQYLREDSVVRMGC
jgi:thioesterase domain-containing protein